MKLDTVTGLRNRHKRGQKLLDKFPVGVPRGEPWPARPPYHSGGVFEVLAAAEGITLQELHLRRRFAFLYTSDDLERLCSYEPPLSWSAIRWLLRVEDCNERESLERKAAAKGWTAAELKRESVRRRGKSHAGGRPIKLPKTLPAGVQETADTARRLEILLRHVFTDDLALASRKTPSSEDAQRHRRKLIASAKAAEAALNQLQECIAEQSSSKKRKLVSKTREIPAR